MCRDSAIETRRLRLVLVSSEALEMLRTHQIEAASKTQGFEFPDDFLHAVNDVFLTRQIDAIRRSPSTPGWSVRAILRKDDDRVIGHCGFHGTPKDVGRAEIGYTVFLPYRRQGYAIESAQGLVDWARMQGSDVVFAAVAPDNHSSLGVVNKLGFRQTTTQGDDEVGQNLVFEMKL
jgi:[ribosomal protein S5]-alanine N-acetyltransferase